MMMVSDQERRVRIFELGHGQYFVGVAYRVTAKVVFMNGR